MHAEKLLGRIVGSMLDDCTFPVAVAEGLWSMLDECSFLVAVAERLLNFLVNLGSHWVTIHCRVHTLLNPLEVVQCLLIVSHDFDGTLDQLVVGVSEFVYEVDFGVLSLVLPCFFHVVFCQLVRSPVD